jgi:hypothetical protein
MADGLDDAVTDLHGSTLVDPFWGDKAARGRKSRPEIDAKCGPPMPHEITCALSARIIGRSIRMPSYPETSSKPYRRIGRW